jgi:hypothetical protein
MPGWALAASLASASVAAVSEYRKGGRSQASVAAAEKPAPIAMAHASRMKAESRGIRFNTNSAEIPVVTVMK